MEADDLGVLQELLQQPLSPLRRTNLLEAMEISRDEMPQSLLLAWLLSAQGPLSDGWLLRQLYEMVSPAVPWPGPPCSVLPEVAQGAERPDIVARWEQFKLIIEYKVGSPEGERQIKRYLKTFEISGPNKGLILFVTPSGAWPKSAEVGDSRVRAISFRQLVDCIDRNVPLEMNERGRVLATEYRDSLNRVINRSSTMAKPVVSETTKLLCRNAERFARVTELAKQESVEFINWLTTQAEQQLRPILGADMVLSVWESWGVFLYRKPHWQTGGLEYGIAYGCEGKLGGRAIHELSHGISVRVQPVEHGATVKGQKRFAESLHEAIADGWPLEDQGWNAWHAAFEEVPFPQDADFDAWGANVLQKLQIAAKSLVKTLDRFAARTK